MILALTPIETEWSELSPRARQRFNVDRQIVEAVRAFACDDEALGVNHNELPAYQTHDNLDGDASCEMVVAEAGCANGSEIVV